MENKAASLIKKYNAGECSPEETALVQEWYLQTGDSGLELSFAEIENAKSTVWLKIKLKQETKKRKIFLQRVAAAACLAIGLAAVLYLTLPVKNQVQLVNEVHDAAPGGNKARLTLADGSVIDLESAEKGQLVDQGGISISKTADGQLVYVDKGGDGTESQPAGTNTITTPRGGQYQVILPDGTKVWLNAASSLKYASVFTRGERRVVLQGEAYFEVAKDKLRPFRVETDKQTVEVLGTHFNINAYPDEDVVKTTLSEGSVLLSNVSGSVRLRPGEQGQSGGKQSKIAVLKDIDVDREMAWKSDLFAFDNDDLKTIMRQLSRWYDLDIVYQGNPGGEKYIGEIPRSSKLSEVLRILELNHVYIDAKGKVLTVTGSAK